MIKLFDNALSDKYKEFHIEREIYLGELFKEIFTTLKFKEVPSELFLVKVNGKDIPNEVFDIIKISPKDEVELRIKLQGGNFGQIAKQVIIIGGTVYASTLAPGVGGAFAALAANIGLTLLMNSLIPTPGLGLPGLGDLGTRPEQSQMYSISGQNNTVQRYGYVPKVYGSFKFFPRVAANPYTDIEIDNSTGQAVQTFYAIYDFGLGPSEISDIKIGDTPILNFSDVKYNLVDLNRPDVDEGSWDVGVLKDFSLYKGDVSNESVAYALNRNEQDFVFPAEDYSATRNAGSNPDNVSQSIVLDFVAPSGLTSYGTDGNRGTASIELEVYFSKVDENVWYSFNDRNAVADFSVQGLGQSNTRRYMPLLPYPNYTGSEYLELYKLSPTSDAWGWPANRNYLIALSQTAGVGDEIEINGRYFGQITSITSSPYSGYSRYYFSNPSPTPFKLFEQFSGDTRPTNWTTAVVSVTRTRATFSANTTSQTFMSIRFTPIEVGEYKVRVVRVRSYSQNSYQIINNLVWQSISTRFDRKPIVTDKRHTFLEVKIRATNQLNGAIQNLSGVVNSALEVYDDNTQTWSRELTSNPAWVFCDMLTGQINKRPLGKTRLDMDSIVEWADFCDEVAPVPPLSEDDTSVRYQSNFVLDYEATLKTVLDSVANSCQASLNLVNGKYGVLLDKNKTIPAQLFTPRNSRGFSSSRQYTFPVHAMVVKYNDPKTDFQLRDIKVYADGYDINNATEFVELNPFGVTNFNQAWRFGRFMLAQATLRQEQITIEVDFENLVCTRGDFVQISQDVMRVGGRPARVKTVSGNQITIDDDIDTDPMLDYGYVFRSVSGIYKSTLTVVNSNTFDLDGTIPSVGDLIVIGEVDQEVLDCLVKSITPQDELTALITLVEKADAIYDAEITGVIPPYTPQITYASDTSQVAPGKVTELEVVANSWFFDSKYNYYVDLRWKAPIGAAYELFEIYVDSGKGYNLVGTTKEIEYRHLVDPEFLGELHSFKVLAVSSSGLKINLGEADAVTATPVRKTTPPSDVLELNINITTEGLQLSWPLVSDTDIREYFIRYNPTLDGSWNTSIPLTRADRNTSTATVQARKGTYLIKAVDYNNKESNVAALAITSIPELLNLNVVEETNDFPTLPGVFDTVENIYGDTLTLTKFGPLQYYSEGYYYFNEILDLGDIYTVRLQSQVEAQGFTEADLMVNWVPLSSVTAMASAGSSSWDVETQVRYRAALNVIANWDPLSDVTSMTEGDIDDWSPWTTFVMGDFTARIFQYRLRLVSYVPSVTPQVINGVIKSDMPDRAERGNDIVSGVGTYSVVYNYEFYGPGTSPNVQITQDSAQAGDRFVITNKTLAGFDITFYDVGDNVVSRTFDYYALGYGRKNNEVI